MLLGDVIMNYLTCQLNRDLEDKQNNSLSLLIIPPLKLPVVDSNLSNMSNSFEKMHKLLFLAIYLPETPTIKSKQSDGTNFFNKKWNFSLVFEDILKTCYDKLDSPEWSSMPNWLLSPKLLNLNKGKKRRWIAVIQDLPYVLSNINWTNFF